MRRSNTLGSPRPEDIYPALAAALNAGDIDAALALYEPGAVFVTSTGESAVTPEAMRAEFQAVVDSKTTISGEAVKVISAGDLALVFVAWQTSSPGPSGTPIELEGISTDVLRRQADATWLSVVDNPIGTALVGDTLAGLFAKAMATTPAGT